MRTIAAAFLVMVGLAASGCFGGGCYDSAHRLQWSDPAVFAALAARAPTDNLTFQAAPVGLPLAADLLPVQDGNASLRSVTYHWDAETPEMEESTLTIGLGREGIAHISGEIDAHLGKRRFTDRVDAFLGAVLADPENASALRQEILAEYDPGRNDFGVWFRMETTAAIEVGNLVASQSLPWAPDEIGHWRAHGEEWEFKATVASWRIRTIEGEVMADAGGWVHGPELDALNDEQPDVQGLQDATAAILAKLEFPALPTDAEARASQRTCVD